MAGIFAVRNAGFFEIFGHPIAYQVLWNKRPDQRRAGAAAGHDAR